MVLDGLDQSRQEGPITIEKFKEISNCIGLSSAQMGLGNSSKTLKGYVPPLMMAKQQSHFQGKENKKLITLEEIENIEKNIESINKQIQDLLKDHTKEEVEYQTRKSQIIATSELPSSSSQDLQKRFKLIQEDNEDEKHVDESLCLSLIHI